MPPRDPLSIPCIARNLSRHVSRPCTSQRLSARRNASTVTSPATASSDVSELEPSSSISSQPAPSTPPTYDPVAQASARKRQLPRSRYQYRPPKYYRGPLHPHQSPLASDPASREFVPGPFSLPRLQQTYDSTIASDILTLSYQHFPFGYEAPVKAPRLRSWDDSSPYHKNRPLRGPRGGEVLNLISRPITFRNIPKPTGITVHSYIKEALEDSGPLHVASMVIQAITGVRCTAHTARSNVQNWGVRQGKFVSLTSELAGEDMYHFLSKLVDVVMPRIRDWKGINGSSGDDNGNISFGITSDIVALFPEIEVNYDSYPPKMLPGAHITIKTSATNDRDARLLLTALGIPFTGKIVN